MTNKNSMSPVAAGVVGAVVGAAVGATAVVLSEEKNRKAIGDKFNEVKEKVTDMAEGVHSSTVDKVDEAKKKVAQKLDV